MDKTDIFCLVGNNGELLPPSLQATVLAKYSRSPLSARELLASLTEEEADKFQGKWVVKYGHNSVAELANIPICFEGVSIVASKIIESWQRAGYSEKSTRYQEFGRGSFIVPPGAPPSMKALTDQLYDAYESLLPKVTRLVAKKMGEDPNAESPKRTVKARAFDNVRYLLPAGTGTNVAAVLNMRDVRDMIVELKSQPNPEFNLIGEGVEQAAKELCPTLIKHTDKREFVLPIQSLGHLDEGFSVANPKPYVKVHRPHLMPQPALQQASFESMVAERHRMSWDDFCQFMSTRPEHCEVPDIFKTINMTFEIMMDFGAFRDLQRHRRCEQYIELLNMHYGYVVPDDITGTELEEEYRNAMELVLKFDDEDVLHNQDLTQYIIPLGYLHRSMFQMDMKELYYIVELRTKPQGHISYRKIAYEMYRLASRRLPKLMQWCIAIEPTEIGAHN